MALRRKIPAEPDVERWLEVDASMTGTLTFKDPVNLEINGQFEGTLDAKGKLFIGEHARVKATIRGETITISGSVEGEITATSRLELTSTAKVMGSARSPRVVMSEGAVLEGTLEMLALRGDTAWMTLQELARYLEVDEATVTQWAQEGRVPAQHDGAAWRFERAKVEEWLAREKIR